MLTFLNTRKSTKTKGSADAALAWRTFTSGAFEDRDREYDRVVTQRDTAREAVGLLIDLAIDLLAMARRLGVDPAIVERFQDRLDEARQLP